jgi:hypothetical protein
VIVPSLAALNCTPRVTALVSAASTAPDSAASCQMLHGHCATAPVVKLHENGLLIATPELFCAPDTVAVYVVLAASELDGVNVPPSRPRSSSPTPPPGSRPSPSA